MNVVTIDFDIVMAPSINLYNDFIGDGVVDEVIEEFPFLKYMPIDYGIYEYLTRYVIAACRHTKHIYFITDHGSVAKVLKRIGRLDDEEVVLYNIDHHHDVTYDDGDLSKKQIFYNCGNWEKYCKDQGLIDKYIWVKNENSENELPDDIEEAYIDEIYNIREFPLEKLYKETDCLIICESGEWVPETYRIMYLIWLAICEEMKGEKYDIDSIKRKSS